MWHMDEIIRAVGGTSFKVENEYFPAISTDSRTIGEGELFVPLRGPNFDGHLFINTAYERSGGGSLCEEGRIDIANNAKGTVILVHDTLQALLDLARYKRMQTGGTFIAITGSNGKTTTKEILVDMMTRAFSVHYNEKNYNNLVGVSKSILSIRGQPEVSILELGTNSKGEIGRLAWVTEPDISVITNINPSHLEGLGDMEGVLEEKLTLFHNTKEGGTLLINADDPYIMPHCKDSGRRALTYGITSDGVNFRLSVNEDLGWGGFDITLHFSGESVDARTRLLGSHNLYNILAAASMAYVAGLTVNHIRDSIEGFGFSSMRFKPVRSKEGYIVIDDSYNANPTSTKWAVKTLLDLPCRGRRIVILGDMMELGEKTSLYHRELGQFLRSSGVDRVLLTGDYVRETLKGFGNGKALFFDDKNRLIDHIKAYAEEGDVLLVKGSRAAKMDEIVEALI